jgi:hypothetical protein
MRMLIEAWSNARIPVLNLLWLVEREHAEAWWLSRMDKE